MASVVYKREEYAGRWGVLVVEQYADKPYFNKFWRWSVDGVKGGDMLLRKPNIKRLKAIYL